MLRVQSDDTWEGRWDEEGFYSNHHDRFQNPNFLLLLLLLQHHHHLPNLMFCTRPFQNRLHLPLLLRCSCPFRYVCSLSVSRVSFIRLLNRIGGLVIGVPDASIIVLQQFQWIDLESVELSTWPIPSMLVLRFERVSDSKQMLINRGSLWSRGESALLRSKSSMLKPPDFKLPSSMMMQIIVIWYQVSRYSSNHAFFWLLFVIWVSGGWFALSFGKKGC